MMGMSPSGANNQLNAMLMSAARFVHNAPPRAAQLQATLTNVQSVINRLGAVPSNTDVVQVRSFTGQTIPETSVRVDQIAQPQRNTGTDLRADARDMPAGTFRFEIEVDGETHTISFTTTEDLTNRAFQQRMADAINDAEIGINASVTTTNNRSVLNLATETTGARENGEPRFTIRDIDGNAVEAMGIDNISQEAQDAIFAISGGDTQTSATNDIDLGGGLAVTLVGTSEEPVTFSAGRDAAGMRLSVRNFVNQFNALLEAARENGSDLRTRQLVRELESIVRRSRRSLQEIGVTMNQNTGLLTINESALQTASENGAIERLLGEHNGHPSAFVRAMTRITDNVRTNPTRHISPHAARFPGFHVALNAVANGNSLANEPATPFDAFMLNDMMGSLFNSVR
jgi:flagellar capping protein FliD